MTKRAIPLYRRHFVMVCGQSNAGPYGDLLSAWPQRELRDPSIDFACTLYNSSVWGTVDNWYQTAGWTKGHLGLSLGNRMRDAGLAPSIATHYVGGASAADMYGYSAEIAGYFAGWYASLVEPLSATLVWSQGEAEAIDGVDSWQSNTEGSIATIRAALSLPTLRVVVVGLPDAYSPERTGGFPHLVATQAAQDALVAADANSSIVRVTTASTVDGIHHAFATQREHARLIVADRWGL